MVKPAEGILVAVLITLAGCASPQAEQPETAAPITPSPIASSIAPSTSPTAVPVAPASVAASPRATAEAEVSTDTVVIPGERVGAVTANTSRQALADLFGEANLKDEAIGVGEGETEPGTTVNLGDRSFTIIWADASRSKPAAVRDFGTAWKTPEGIGIGTSFATLQEKLGDFELFGLAWDYGGTVVLTNSRLKQYDELMILRLNPAADAHEKHAADYNAVTGDTQFPSTSPHFQPLGLTVGEMIIYFEPANNL